MGNEMDDKEQLKAIMAIVLIITCVVLLVIKICCY